jgi:hypothetical protein
MFFNKNKPLNNTIIVFTCIMLLLCITKPDYIYDNDKKEFREFGTDNGNTLLPIYIIGVLLAMITYIFFSYLSKKSNNNLVELYTLQNEIKKINTKINNNIQKQIMLNT